MTIITDEGPCELLPNLAIMITDDETAKTYLAKHGMLAPLQLQPEHSFVAVGFESSAAWVYAMHIRPRPEKDHGYIVIMLPKGAFTKETAEEFGAKAVNEVCPDWKRFTINSQEN